MATIQSQPLAARFFCGVRDQILGLGGEADDEARAAIAGLAQRREDVGIFGELQRRRRAVFLELLRRGLDPPIGHGRGADRDLDRQRRLARLEHVARGFDMRRTVTPGGSGSAVGPGDQHRLGAGARQRGRDGVALLARGAVGEIAHRVDRLVRRAAGDERAAALERTGRRASPRWRRRSPAARPCGLARSRPRRARRHWGRCA